MTWLQIIWKFFELFRAVLAKVTPPEQQPQAGKKSNKPGPVKKKKEYGPPKADKGGK